MQIIYLAIQGGIFSSRNVHMTNKSLHIYCPIYFKLSQHLLITKISNVIYHSTYVMKLISNWLLLIIQGKSEGFDSCDQPSNFTQIGFKLAIFFYIKGLTVCLFCSKPSSWWISLELIYFFNNWSAHNVGDFECHQTVSQGGMESVTARQKLGIKHISLCNQYYWCAGIVVSSDPTFSFDQDSVLVVLI